MNLLTDSASFSEVSVPIAAALFTTALLAGLWRLGRASAEHAAHLGLGVLLVALAAAALTLFTGPAQIDVLQLGGVDFGFRLDALSVVMLVLVAFLGAVVTRYSVNYLDGDPGQARFSRWLCATLGSVVLLVVSNNLLMFTLFWVSTSLCLHQLLTFYPERKAGVLAARKKFLISRLGDVCLLASMVLVWQAFGTWDFQELFVAASGPLPGQAEKLTWISGLLVAGALMKSAQVPFHSWLPDTMETPTPVSALMHAGVINAGGFLVIRLSPLIIHSPAALNMLALVGAFTALFASVVMMTQTSIKRSLAWSTVAQMGFMMLQCGLGAFALAVLHIVAHSLYKAHAFLAAGSIVNLTRSAWTPSVRPAAHPFVLMGAIGTSVILSLTVGTLFGLDWTANPGVLLLCSVFIMALAHLLWTLWNSSMRWSLLGWGLLMAAGAAFACFGLHAGFEHLLSACLPSYAPERTLSEHLVMGVVALLFMGVLVLQSQMPLWTDRPWFSRLYVHACNGFYLGTLLARLTSRLSPR